MAKLKGNPVYILAVAQQLVRANVHFKVVFDFDGCVLSCKHQTTLDAAEAAYERLKEKKAN